MADGGGDERVGGALRLHAPDDGAATGMRLRASSGESLLSRFSAHRRISTFRDLSEQAFLKEGYLLKQSRTFQRWRRRYFKLRGRKLFYAGDAQATLFNEVQLSNCSVAECGSKGANSFQIITPFSVIVLGADTRQQMDEWIASLKSASKKEFYESGAEQYRSATSGQHTWYVCSHSRPTFCNHCNEALSGVAWHGLSCEVCKLKAHKQCAAHVAERCKWTTVGTVPPTLILRDNDAVPSSSAEALEQAACLQRAVMPHQWVQGNLPMSARCAVCARTCGSVLRLQDWRCLWCGAFVHDACRPALGRRCPLGVGRLSVLPPVALRRLSARGVADLVTPIIAGSPLLVVINSKSGDNQGVRLLRRFKRLLNPAQVFDLMQGGPEFGLLFFQAFDSFRVLVGGGDGSVGWVLAIIDQMNLHSKCQVGILPLGTGNDLSRVLGWGHAFDDEAHLPGMLERLERAHTKMLDRWSVRVYESKPTETATASVQAQYDQSEHDEGDRHHDAANSIEASVAKNLSNIFASEDNSVVISSAKHLCETIKGFLSQFNGAESGGGGGGDSGSDSINVKCTVLEQKLNSLLQALEVDSRKAAAEEQRAVEPDASSSDDSAAEMSPQIATKFKHRQFVQREALMGRANSLKKAVRQIVESAERAVDEQNLQTAHNRCNEASRSRSSRAKHAAPRSLASSAGADTAYLSAKSQSSHLPTLSLDGASTSSEESAFGAAAAAESRAEWTSSGFGTTVIESDDDDDDELGAAGARLPMALVPPPMCVQPPTPHSSLPGSPLTPALPLGDPHESSDADPSEPFSLSEPAIVLAASTSSSAIRLDSGASSSLLASPALPPKRAISDSSLIALRRLSRYCGAKSGAESDWTPLRLRGPSLPARTGGLVSGSATGGLVAQVLLMNADLLGVAASPLMHFEDIPLADYEEKKVMNNYFGIGLDAKIALEFHQKREEYSRRARSRSKLYMWYGMLSTKELLQRTFRNLEQRVQVECDGRRIQLPSLQGIVILNIPSYQGGMNFWGSTKGGSVFSSQSFDDRVLEVVAVFGVIHCATSRVVRLQNHRIAQCRRVRIVISGDEPIPVQVDGEPWMQPPGYIQIVHKNRAQVLVRNPQFEAVLMTWAEMHGARPERGAASVLLRTMSRADCRAVLAFVDDADAFVHRAKQECTRNASVSRLVGESASEAAAALQRVARCRTVGDAAHVHQDLTVAVAAVGQLIEVLRNADFGDDAAESVRSLREAADLLDAHRLPVDAILNLTRSASQHEQLDRLWPERRRKSQGDALTSRRRRWRVAEWLRSTAARLGRRQRRSSVVGWSAADVGGWLEQHGLAEYRANFRCHEIGGSELIRLERRDLKDLGVVKVGHIKKLQSAIQALNERSSSNRERGAVSAKTDDDSFSSI